MNDEVWILVADDGTVSAYDTQDAAINAAIDMDHPYIECVTLNRAQEAPEGVIDARTGAGTGERATEPHNGSRRRSWIAPPQLTIDGHWTNA